MCLNRSFGTGPGPKIQTASAEITSIFIGQSPPRLIYRPNVTTAEIINPKTNTEAKNKQKTKNSEQTMYTSNNKRTARTEA